ncbi:MAG TPA: acetate--CoA ligase family protein [Beijerinckiaceae bacterium]|jgi:acyl-CoA synthetase (NDP forming)|nr:acetate--CoA ligase family protein [Beijerinckiaceae bacterium]
MSAETTSQHAIQRLLRPRSIAIVGASPTPGALGNSVLGNLDRFGYQGAIHLINPNRTEINGRPCLKSTRDLPEGVDCAVLAVPQAAAMDAVQGCIERGVGGVVIFGAGFAELNAEGRQAQEHLARIARDAGMAIEGPNCLGYINYVDGVPMTFAPTDNVPLAGRRAVGIVSQSGAMATVLRTALHAHDIAVSLFVSTGNEALNGLEDFLDLMIEDETTHVLALVAEQFRDPPRFRALMRRARELHKPVVLLHPGRSAAARESAQTHTGAMSGDWDVMRALTEREGVAVVETLEQLIDVAELFIRFPEPIIGGPAIITDSGAYKGMSLDYCQQIGLDLPQPSPAAHAILDGLAPGLIHGTNPLDLTAQALVDPLLYRKALDPLLIDDAFGSVIYASIVSSGAMAPRKFKPVVDAAKEARFEKPVMIAMLGDDGDMPRETLSELRALNIPFFRSPERCLRALAFLQRYYRRKQAPIAPVARKPYKHKLLAGIIPEHVAKKILEAEGIPVPPAEFVTTIEDAQAAARRMGYPVALKAQASELAHKSDVGGVILGLNGDKDLADGWSRLYSNVALGKPDLVLDGVLVEKMAPRGVELIFGARNDKDWGPVLVVGLGGVFTEALHDVVTLAPDLGAEAIATELRRLKGAALLGAFRGSPARDVDAAAAIAAKLGAFIMAHPEVAEVDVNPVIVHGEGEGALALDALIVVR